MSIPRVVRCWIACLIASLVVCRASARMFSTTVVDPFRGPEAGSAANARPPQLVPQLAGNVQGVDARKVINVGAAVVILFSAHDRRGSDGVVDDLRVRPGLV